MFHSDKSTGALLLKVQDQSATIARLEAENARLGGLRQATSSFVQWLDNCSLEDARFEWAQLTQIHIPRIRAALASAQPAGEASPDEGGK